MNSSMWTSLMRCMLLRLKLEKEARLTSFPSFPSGSRSLGDRRTTTTTTIHRHHGDMLTPFDYLEPSS